MSMVPPRGEVSYVNGVMACPLCGDGDGTHVEHAYVAARREGQEFTDIHVDAVEGTVEQQGAPSAPAGPGVGEGRRHRIALTGWCEMCGGEYAIIFTQHKGATLLEAVPINQERRFQTGQSR